MSSAQAEVVIEEFVPARPDPRAQQIEAVISKGGQVDPKRGPID